MLNKEINLRFEDWLLSPGEALDFEVKGWLDMADVESQGLVAKALIALENHGGGFFLFGFQEDAHKKLEPDPNVPVSLKPYLGDALNAIVKGRAEPSFHVEVSLQTHPGSGVVYPLVRVPGTSKVPVRSDSATAGGALKQHVYYIRAPGPESRGPLNGTEWNQLLRRAVLNQRDEIVSVLRAFLPAAGSTPAGEPSPDDQHFTKFIAVATAKWIQLNQSLPEIHPSRIKLGHFRFAAKAVGTSRNMTAPQIRDANERAKKYTGWPAFVTLHQEDTKPKVVDNGIEAWLANTPYPDSSHADFWRIQPDGHFFLLRGYQEDSPTAGMGPSTVGKYFEATLPIWRLGEFLLRVSELGDVMYEGGFELIVECEWTGLSGRQLYVHNHRRSLGGGEATQDVLVSKGRFPGAIRDVLPEVVKMLTAPLYALFDFMEIPDAVYAEELSDMTKQKY